ncbi:MAG TPA: ion channel [Rudaea sp.]|nr:ion channel [Rudaea sp.]
MLGSSVVNAQAEPAAEYGNWGVNSIIVVVTAIAVLLCVLLHYEVLNFLSRWLVRLEGQRRRRVLFAIFGVLAAHVTEIWIFGMAYILLSVSPAFGSAHGIGPSLLDYVYISAMTFTTVGMSDAYLDGPIRFVCGNEALTGLVLITWSASFTFLEMERFWRDR